MKKKMTRAVGVAACLVLGLTLFGCEGETGPMGPEGPQGPAGPKGNDGDSYIMGYGSVDAGGTVLSSGGFDLSDVTVASVGTGRYQVTATMTGPVSIAEPPTILATTDNGGNASVSHVTQLDCYGDDAGDGSCAVEEVVFTVFIFHNVSQVFFNNPFSFVILE